jgi:hypothetical protein
MHPLLHAAAERQLGLFTALDARRAGYSPGEVRHLLSSRQWVRVRRGVYRLTPATESSEDAATLHRLDALATLLALGRPTAVLSHATAARLLGVPVRRGFDRTIRLTDPEGQWRRGENFLVSRAPLGSDEIIHKGPLRLTAPARTLVDCAREWSLDEAVVALDAALLYDLVTESSLRQTVEQQRHWPGIPRAARAVELADGRAESPLETRGRLRIIGAGLPTPELQVEIRVGGRLIAVADAWFEEAALAVEFDGRVKYTDPWRGRDPRQVLWEEKRREDDVRALDIRVVRMVDADVDTGWPRMEARLWDQLSRPGPSRRAFTATPRERGRRRAG